MCKERLVAARSFRFRQRQTSKRSLVRQDLALPLRSTRAPRVPQLSREQPLHILQLTSDRVDFIRGYVNLDDPSQVQAAKGRARVAMNESAREALVEGDLAGRRARGDPARRAWCSWRGHVRRRQSANQQLTDLPSTPVLFLALDGDDACLELGRQLIGEPDRPARAVGERFEAVLLVAVKDLVSGFAGDAEIAADLSHRLKVQETHSPAAPRTILKTLQETLQRMHRQMRAIARLLRVGDEAACQRRDCHRRSHDRGADDQTRRTDDTDMTPP